MLSSNRAEFLEDLATIVGLITVQVIYAVYAVFMSHLLSLGLTPFFLIIYGSFATALLLSPLAFFFERSKWPRNFKPVLLFQLILLALGGIIFQLFMLLGIRNTSPAIASAMPNLAPGFIFIIAWCLRFEKVDLECVYSKTKIMGTLVCLAGALAMSFLQATPAPNMVTSPGSPITNSPSDEILNKTRLIGATYLLVAVFAISCTMILQAATMGDFPAPLSLCVISSLMGSVLVGTQQFIQKGKLDTGSDVISLGSLIAFALLGGTVGGLCTAFQTWAVKKRGPVFASVFSPIGTVCSAILSALTLGEALTVGSITGMFLMFSGLYSVLWAKKKEGYKVLNEDGTPEIGDPEKPLLS